MLRWKFVYKVIIAVSKYAKTCTNWKADIPSQTITTSILSVFLMMTVRMMVMMTTTTTAKTTIISRTIYNAYDDHNIKKQQHRQSQDRRSRKNINMKQDIVRQGGKPCPPCLHVHKSFCPTPAVVPMSLWANITGTAPFSCVRWGETIV